MYRTPILKNWAEDIFDEHQPVAMFPIGLQHIFNYNLQKSTAAYERLVGDSAAAVEAATKAVQGTAFYKSVESIEMGNEANNDST
jgi:hypothetical protein